MEINSIQRDYSIDIVRFIAALSITWSHMDIALGEYSMFATGGTFGDVLFFFCSGYTLALGKNTNFFNWYKKRINRIYPTIFSWSLLSSILFGDNKNLEYIILHGGGWFVSCIMIHYAIMWIILHFFRDRIYEVMVIVIIISIGWYFIWGQGESMYGETYFKWIHYFLFMLLGTKIGTSKQKESFSGVHSLLTCGIIIVCIVAFYLLFSFHRHEGFSNSLQLLSLIPLCLFCYYLYIFCNNKSILKMFTQSKIGYVARFISGLCLEVYLVQRHFITDSLNFIFPANIGIIFIQILGMAYLLQCVSKFWRQTFREAQYDWKAIIKPSV